jgi:hypothetical protein
LVVVWRFEVIWGLTPPRSPLFSSEPNPHVIRRKSEALAEGLADLFN